MHAPDVCVCGSRPRLTIVVGIANSDFECTANAMHGTDHCARVRAATVDVRSSSHWLPRHTILIPFVVVVVVARVIESLGNGELGWCRWRQNLASFVEGLDL